jgi:hypothetical protein
VLEVSSVGRHKFNILHVSPSYKSSFVLKISIKNCSQYTKPTKLLMVAVQETNSKNPEEIIDCSPLATAKKKEK